MNFSLFSRPTLGIDPGSHSLRIIKDGVIVFNERNRLSLDKIENIITGFGDSISTSNNNVTILNPVNYVIADFRAFDAILRGSIAKILGEGKFFKNSLTVYFCIPTYTNQIEKRAYLDAAEHSNAFKRYMIYQSYCAATSMNILFEKKDFMLIDFSYSKIEMVIFANSSIVSKGILKLGLSKIFSLIKNYCLRKHKVRLNEEEILDFLKIISAEKQADKIKIQNTAILINEIQDLLSNFFYLVNDELIETIERVSNHPNIHKILINGVYFTGGGSTISFLREQINLDNSIKIHISENPILDNIIGLKSIMSNIDKYKKYLLE
jgi:rod shape-determining protein MreB